MAFQPVGFTGRTVRAKDHGAAFAAIMGDGRVSGCELTYSNGTATLTAGWLVADGRLIYNNASIAETITGSSGYVQLVLVVDASNTGAVSIVKRTASSISGFPALSQGDINGSATTYEMELGVVDIAGNTLARVMPLAARPVYVTTAAPTSSSPDGIYLVTES